MKNAAHSIKCAPFFAVFRFVLVKLHKNAEVFLCMITHKIVLLVFSECVIIFIRYF